MKWLSLLLSFLFVVFFLCKPHAASSQVKFNSCGLDATWRSNVTFYDGSNCDATVSDVNEVTCSSAPSLKLSIHRCSADKRPSIGKIAFLRFSECRELLRSSYTVQLSPEYKKTKFWRAILGIIRYAISETELDALLRGWSKVRLTFALHERSFVSSDVTRCLPSPTTLRDWHRITARKHDRHHREGRSTSGLCTL